MARSRYKKPSAKLKELFRVAIEFAEASKDAAADSQSFKYEKALERAAFALEMTAKGFAESDGAA